MNRKIALVTAGPTREYLDPVRYLSNASSGRMGTALAQELKSLGFQVTLILGPGVLSPAAIPSVRVVSASQMYREVAKRFSKCGLFISTAAVSDFRPEFERRGKIRRTGKSLLLKLVPNPDILYEMGRRKRDQVCVGFALEDGQGLRRAFAKMFRKKCDLMVLNGPRSIESDKISATLLFPDQSVKKLGKIKKKECARKICRVILQSFPGKFKA